MIELTGLSDQAVEFITECRYGDRWREIRRAPEKYYWLRTLMRTEMREVMRELEDAGLATRTRDGRTLINMSRLPQLEAVLLRIENQRREHPDEQIR